MSFITPSRPAIQAFDAPGARGLIVPHTPEGDAVMRGLLDGLCGPERIVRGDIRKDSYWAGASEHAVAVRG